MEKRVKVGQYIYNEGNLVAEFTHGAWYYYVKKKGFWVLEPCTADVAQKYADMVDAFEAPMSDGELLVLHHAKNIIGTKAFPEKHEEVLQLVERQIKTGICKHGPYHPGSDKRDFLALMVRSVTNAIVYGCMYLTQPDAKPLLGERMVGNTIELLARLLRAVGKDAP